MGEGREEDMGEGIGALPTEVGRSAALRVEPASPSQAKPAAANAFTPEAIEAASIEVERLQRELDITNADHIALWLEANMTDSPLGWLACRIVEAFEKERARGVIEERKRIIASGCIHTRKRDERGNTERPDLLAWQAAQNEWFDPTMLEIVTEYAEWRDKKDANPPRHRYWGAGERDAPKEIRAGNGELHTMRCKVCGLDNPIDRICRPRRVGGAA